MLRTVADAVSEAVLASLAPERPYSPAAFSTSPVPRPVAHFLEHVIAWNLEDVASELRHINTEWFDDENAEVLAARDALNEAIAEHAHIPQHRWKKQVSNAVYHSLHYLVRPAPALADFAFEGITASMPVSLVRKRISFFSPYSYLSDAADVYFEEKNLRKIDRERFLAMLRQVDRQMTGENTSDEWIALLQPLLEYVKLIPASDGGDIPLPLLILFFEEKAAPAAVQRLEQLQDPESGRETVDTRELRNVLESCAPDGQVATGQAAKEAPSVGASPDPSSEAVPLWKQFQNRPKDASGASGSSSPAESGQREESSDMRPRWQQFQSKRVERSGGNGNPDDVERQVLGKRGKRNRRMFVRRLFGGSEEAYFEALRRLARANTWPQASRIIAEDVFKKHGINIYSDEAVSFTDAVEAQHRAS